MGGLFPEGGEGGVRAGVGGLGVDSGAAGAGDAAAVAHGGGDAAGRDRGDRGAGHVSAASWVDHPLWDLPVVYDLLAAGAGAGGQSWS